MTVHDPTLSAIEGFFAGYAANDRDRIAALLADEIEWTIPGHHPLSGTKREIDEVRALFAALDTVGFTAETFLLQTGDDSVVDIHRGYSTGEVDTTLALAWHFNESRKVDRVVNRSSDQHQMDVHPRTPGVRRARPAVPVAVAARTSGRPRPEVGGWLLVARAVARHGVVPCHFAAGSAFPRLCRAACRSESGTPLRVAVVGLALLDKVVR